MTFLQDQREEALSLLNQSEETIRESYGDESEKRLIVTYGDMAWLKYHVGDFAQSQSYCQRVEDTLKLKQIAEKRLSRNPGDGEALALLGQVARAEGNRKEAAEFYEEALNCDKDNEEYLSALCELRLELQGSSSD
ncbi:interferon-induced protein with tetratricopeptide repeats 1-like isoform X1 [Oreochromis aureus]|uniref:interferon-induced protein with tetratricopeptide repeats 1-like isoform X1 n=1 Tax=Oreochromis aureus TaxID=47969 RepID=UPI001954C364|nr:interferon-induced protein with tetratricopeptide repeats 1-like isoform X1 [Oreochromis aureus]